MELGRLSQPHQRFPGSVRWHLDTRGLCVDGGSPEVTGGEPLTVRRVWGEFGPAVEHWCSRYSVPVELVVATICTESGGDPEAARKEPGFTNDASTPHRVSVGLMQTLISTARESLEKPDVDRAWLLIPDNSIRAGTSYIAGQKRKTLFDPPVVACAYNAGSVIENAGAENRWRMKQFPIGTGHHADRYVKWFNDCFRVFSDRAAAGDDVPALSFYRLLRERAAQPADAA